MSQVSNNNDRRGPLQLSKKQKNMNKSGIPVAIGSPEVQQQHLQQIIQTQLQLPSEPIVIDDCPPVAVIKQSNNKNNQSNNKVSAKIGNVAEESAKNVQNGSNNKNGTSVENGNNKKATNGSHKVEEKSEPVVTPKDSPKIRESPRKAAENNGTSKDSTVEVTVEGVEPKVVLATPPRKQDAQPKKVEASAIVLEITPEKASASLLTEKDLKGYDSDGFEMEALLVDGTEYEDSPIPSKLGGSAGKNLRSGTASRSRISPFRRSERLQNTNTSTIVNLSTVSEQSSEQINSSNPDAEKSYSESLRFISGRKATRPLKEINLSYRKSVLNASMDSNSSMNVTIGSEIPNDSFRTPFFARKRKEGVDGEEDELRGTDSPKRARLDFSGLLGVIASPVTMLKNKFTRVKLQPTSTPNKDETANANTESVNEEPPIAINNDNFAEQIEVAIAGGEIPEPVFITGGENNAANDEQIVGDAGDMNDIEIREVSDKNTSRCNIM